MSMPHEEGDSVMCTDVSCVSRYIFAHHKDLFIELCEPRQPRHVPVKCKGIHLTS